MELRLVSRGIEELLPMQRSGDPRCHISYIIRYLCIKLGHFPDNDDREDPAVRQARFELGSAFEDAIGTALAERWAKQFPDRFVRPGELELDSMIGTPDLIDLVLNAIIEVKLTWLSSRHDPEDSVKFWKYWVQLKAYCHMWGTNIGFLHVAHVMGNYRDDRNVDYRVWEAKFTDAELYENWRMLVSHSRKLRGLGK